MKTIIVGFSHSTKKFAPFSKALQHWDNVPYSHVYFQFHADKHDVDMVYQASSNMLNYMSKPVFLSINAVVEEIEIQVSDSDYNKLMKSCMESAGLEYALLQVVGIAIADIFNLDKNILSNPDKYVCSEWVAEQLEHLGYKFDKPLDLIKPKDIYIKLKD